MPSVHGESGSAPQPGSSLSVLRGSFHATRTSPVSPGPSAQGWQLGRPCGALPAMPLFYLLPMKLYASSLPSSYLRQFYLRQFLSTTVLSTTVFIYHSFYLRQFLTSFFPYIFRFGRRNALTVPLFIAENYINPSLTLPGMVVFCRLARYLPTTAGFSKPVFFRIHLLHDVI